MEIHSLVEKILTNTLTCDPGGQISSSELNVLSLYLSKANSDF